MKYLYKLPQKEFPYKKIIEENAKRSRTEREYNLIDTGIFDESRYWDCNIETAKEGDDPEELLFRVTCYNRGPEAAKLHIIPQVWFRNTWAWGYDSYKPEIKQAVERIFNVDVASVNTLNRSGKRRRTRFGWGQRKSTKRAIVTLKDGTIDIFGCPLA